MRRFLAYVIMMLTMLFAIVFNTQAVLENKVDAMEYGTGTQLVYSISKREAKDYSSELYPTYSESGTLKDLSDIDIEAAVMKRLDAAGVRNADVSIVQGKNNEGYQLRINLSPLSSTELSNVKEILAFTGYLSIGTVGDTLVYCQAKDEFFEDQGDVATLVYNGTTPYPTLKVRDVDTFDKLKKAAEEAKDNKTSEAKRFYADDSSDDSSSDSSEESVKAYLWFNKTTSDTYAKAYGTDETVVMEETKAKVLCEIDLSNWDSDNLQLSLTTDSEGNEFTISTARAFVNMLNCYDYGFDISFLYQNSLSATFGSSAITLTYIIFGVVLLVICALLIAFYGLAGVTASLTMLGSVLLSFFLFSILGFEFSISALCGLAVIVGLSVMISVNYFERVKSEIRHGRNVIKANQEGYHKSFLTSLDVSAIALIASVFCFLVGTGGFKTFFGVIMIGSIFTFILTNYINKWMMYWLLKGNADSKLPFFSFKAIKEEKIVNTKFASTDKKHFSKKTLIGIPALTILALAIGLPVGYVLSGNQKSFFNNYNDFASTYTLNIEFNDNNQAYEKLSTSEAFTYYIAEIGKSSTSGKFNAISSEVASSTTETDSFIYYPKSATLNVVERHDDENNKYYTFYYTLKVSKNLNDVKDSNQTEALKVIENAMFDETITSQGENIAPFAGDSHGVKDSLVVSSYEVKATNVTHTSNYLILLAFLISCFAFVYIICRFGINVSLASLGSGTIATGLYIGLLALLRIPYSSYTVFSVLISVLLLNMFMVPVLGKNREILKERGLKKTATDEQRAEITNECVYRTFSMIIPVFAILLVYSIGLAFVNTALIGLSISSIIFLVLDLIIIYFFAVPLYHLLSTKITYQKLASLNQERAEKRAIKKNKKLEEIRKVAGPDGVVYVDDGPHETIIVGLNDFKQFD